MSYFFDLDGTLLDHPHAQASGIFRLTRTFPEFCHSTDSELYARWSTAERLHFPRYERKELSYTEQRRERLREVFPKPCGKMSQTELDSLYEHYLEGYREGWRLYPDVLATFQRLGKHPKALITNGSSELQREKIRRLELQSHFEAIIVSGEFSVAKPHPDIFTKACEMLDVSPSSAHYVGDNFHNDVKGSYEAGMSAIWLNRERLPSPLPFIPHIEIHTLLDLTEER